MSEQKDPSTGEDLPVAQQFWQALDGGRLMYQQCGCGHRWLPPRTECPNCLQANWVWRQASGRGRVISWVVYFVAYDEAFKNKIPYNVAIVELEEGVRLISNIIDRPDGTGLVADMPVELSVTRTGDAALATFVSTSQ